MTRKAWFRLSFIALMPLILMQMTWAFIGIEHLLAPTKLSLLSMIILGLANMKFLAWSCIVCLICLGIIGFSMLLYFKNAPAYEKLEKAEEAYHEACRQMEEARDIFNKKTLEYGRGEKGNGDSTGIN